MSDRSALVEAPAGLRREVPLAPLTTLGIGGPARFFLAAGSVEELRHGLEWAAAEGIPALVLGGGSNVLIPDDGFPGLVLLVDLRGIEVEEEGDGARLVRAAAGEPWDDFVAEMTAQGLAGVECLSGIPGRVGATPIQNVGAYGQEVSDTIVEVEALERSSGRLRRFTNAECGFRYRYSVFKDGERDRWVVSAVTFRLQPGGPAKIEYPDLAAELAAAGVDVADLRAVREAVIAVRRRKGMVVDPADPDSRSDGSFFMNPIVAPAEYEAIVRRARERLGAANVPSFPSPEGVKVPAAWLIEKTGFHKGYRHGNVGISSKHALAIVNRGGGTAAEVRELVATIRGRVHDELGVLLHPEPVWVGDGDW